VTLPTRRLDPAPTGLVEKLLGAVGAEFRVEVYVPAPDDPVLGRPWCSVPGCDRSGWEYGLCGGHNNRWRMQGRPELAGFLADAGTALNGRRGLSHCTVAGCRFGSSGFGLCMRHFACRLINRDVPQEVVRVLLDHESMQMTAHYARITDQTVRRRWEQATKVNINGEHVTLDPDGPLGQAQWAKTRYGIATQSLPHGYCGLPVQKSCPHANACLTCPVFLTGPEFLPELRAHRDRTLTLIDQAQVTGHSRVAEMNQQVLTNLDRMITEVDDVDDRDEQADAG